MRVALISEEYAGALTSGGIGSYTRAAAEMLSDVGHDVEVFTSDQGASASSPKFPTHFIRLTDQDFRSSVVEVFRQRHLSAPFDVVEGPEYRADALEIARLFPSIALVTKLQTPAVVVDQINHQFVPWQNHVRFALGAVRRGQRPKPLWRYEPEKDNERTVALLADELTACSRALANATAQLWGVDNTAISVLPNVITQAHTGALNRHRNGQVPVVTFLGRIEIRKGVLDLAKAIPSIISRHPNTRFRFIGRSLPHPATGEDLTALILRKLGRHASAVEFVGAVPYDRVVDYLLSSDICVLPSIWEAEGIACKEAMIAGCAVVATAGSGMAEFISHGETGLLVRPRSPSEIASSVCSLLGSPQRASEIGLAARNWILSEHSPAKIAPRQEEVYRSAIKKSLIRKITKYPGAFL
jgi:glycogen synthase